MEQVRRLLVTELLAHALAQPKWLRNDVTMTMFLNAIDGLMMIENYYGGDDGNDGHFETKDDGND